MCAQGWLCLHHVLTHLPRNSWILSPWTSFDFTEYSTYRYVCTCASSCPIFGETACHNIGRDMAVYRCGWADGWTGWTNAWSSCHTVCTKRKDIDNRKNTLLTPHSDRASHDCWNSEYPIFAQLEHIHTKKPNNQKIRKEFIYKFTVFVCLSQIRSGNMN